MASPFRDHPLGAIIAALGAKNIHLGKARNEYLRLEAERKHFEATLIQASEGKSHAERTNYAQTAPGWLAFHQKLARAESEYEFHRLEFSILEKEYQAQYLQLKLDHGLIQKQGE